MSTCGCCSFMEHGQSFTLRTLPNAAGRPLDALRSWGIRVRAKAGHNKAAVAIANKLARIIWATWRRQRDFEFRAPQLMAA